MNPIVAALRWTPTSSSKARRTGSSVASLGSPLGALFGWALVRALARDGITEFVVSPVQLSVYLAVAGGGRSAGRYLAREAGRSYERLKGHSIQSE